MIEVIITVQLYQLQSNWKRLNLNKLKPKTVTQTRENNLPGEK